MSEFAGFLNPSTVMKALSQQNPANLPTFTVDGSEQENLPTKPFLNHQDFVGSS